MIRRNAFTLIELLIVVGIIVVLVAILLPTLSTAREQARAVRCQNNIHRLWQGMLAFASEHENRLPGAFFDAANPDPDKRDWMMGAKVGNRDLAPQSGTLFKYVGHSYDIYRCPSLELAESSGTSGGPGGGSNGRFDYSAFIYVTGCRLDRLPSIATVIDTSTNQTTTFPAPVIVEEEPSHMNSGHPTEAGHSNTDSLSSTHHGGSHFGGTDGSVQWIGLPWINAQANDWSAVSVRHKTVKLGATGITWGWYEKQ